MKIIIAPAKRMKVDLDSFPVQSRPPFLAKTQILANFLRTRSKEQLKELWRANDQIVAHSQKQLQQLDLHHRLTPAIIAFTGLQFQYMAPDVFTEPALHYIQQHLRILSGFYGCLRPFDGVAPYRLEMKTAMVGFRDYSLYHFWGPTLADALFAQDKTVLNLASKEYSRAIKPYLNDGRQMISVVFQEKRKGKWRIIPTHAKMARGEMVRYLAEKQIKNPAGVQDFHDFGFVFQPELSTSDRYLFRTDFAFKRG